MIHKITRGRPWAAAALLSSTVLVAASTIAVNASASSQVGSSVDARAAQGSVNGVMQHLIELEEIGDDHGGRPSGTPGYAASRDYIVKKLKAAGYDPRVQTFEFPYFEQLAPSVFQQTSPTERTFEEDVDYGLMTYSGSGSPTATVQAVDTTEVDASTSGCEASDFAGFVPGNIALIRRGTCPFGQKAMNAEDAGAVAVIIFNQGNSPDRTEAIVGTLGEPVGLPVVGTSTAIGESLIGPDVTVHIEASTESEIRDTYNVLAETSGRKKNVVMAGAHLDSVQGANGINDNGSGSAALLETAEKMATEKKTPNNRVRFAWWGAEELGLLGSEHYVAKLAENRPGAFQNIALYLNFDMVSSPNYILGVYDGNNDAFPPEESATAPQGSAAIERMFHRFFDRYGTNSVETAFSGRSDYGPFIALNVPAGGLFTGAEGIKTAEEVALFGGTAGEAYDECYHQACDDLGNVNRRALKANTAAIIHAVSKYARSTRTVNGNRTGHQPPEEPAPRHAHRTAHRHPGDPVAR